MPTLQPYMRLGAVEVANALRTFTYLRRGLGGGAFNAELAGERAGESGYSDTYGDTYYADPYWPGNLACYCSALDGGPYVSPADDPAPWYDSSRPESADFLGFVPSLTLVPVIARTTAARGTRGGVIGAHRPAMRVLQVTAEMYAASEAGMAWGERWLNHALTGALEGCDLDDLRILPACPPDDAEEPTDYFRTLRNVGLVDGPTFGDEADIPACHIQRVAFQLAAAFPHLMGPAAVCVAEYWLENDTTACCAVTPDATIGDTALRLTLRAGQVGSSVRDVEVTATFDSACPSSEDAAFAFTVETLPKGAELVIDASTRTVTVTDALSGEAVGGLDVLDFDGIFDWSALEAQQGEQLCVCVDATGASLNHGTRLLVEQIPREL